jgi:hypothetical protein
MCIGLSVLLLPLSVRAETSLAPGSWYTEGIEHNDYLQAFVTFKADGTFEKLIRTLQECKVKGEWVESGNWTLANSQLQFLTTQVARRNIDPSDEYYVNTFLVTPLDATNIKIFDLETLLTWKLVTATPPLKFPDVQDCVVA